MKDGYRDILSHLNVEEEAFIKIGIDSVIDASIKIEEAKKEWMSLVERVESGGDRVFVRSYGRGRNSEEWIKFLNEIFPNANLMVDRTNNDCPKKIIKKLTNYSNKLYKSKQNDHIGYLMNYRVSHVFGKTKNPFAFTAPWNIVYLPIIFDPLTGHESSGEMSLKFSKLLKSKVYRIFEVEIDQFNKLMEEKDSLIKKHVDSNREILSNGMIEDIEKQFSPINIKEFLD